LFFLLNNLSRICFSAQTLLFRCLTSTNQHIAKQQQWKMTASQNCPVMLTLTWRHSLITYLWRQTPLESTQS